MTDLIDRPALDAPETEEAPAAPAPPPVGEGPPGRPPSGRTTWDWAQLITTIAVVAGCALYTLAQLHPDLILRNTTPSGGDMGAHVWGPAFLRDHILPHWRLSGWANDWYAGFPLYRFYMIPPALAIVLLDVVLPYGTAFKLVAVAGIVSLPVCTWAFGRLSGMRYPIPPMLAIASVFFLFMEGNKAAPFQIYGGNIASTMAGEYSFSIALSVAVLFLGVFTYALRTGRYRALAAVLFALAALCHVIVCFFALVGAVVLWLLWVDERNAWKPLRQRAPALASFVWPFAILGADAVLYVSQRWGSLHLPDAVFLGLAAIGAVWLILVDTRRALVGVAVGAVGGLIAAFWYLPFVAGDPYLTDMFYERLDNYWDNLFPYSPVMAVFITGLALVGVVGSLVRGRRAGVALGAIMVIYAAWFVRWPQSHLWNARLLPFLYLSRYLLAAIGVADLAAVVVWAVRVQARERLGATTDGDRLVALQARLAPARQRQLVQRAGVVTLSASAVLAVGALGLHLENLPGFEQRYDQTRGEWVYGPKGVDWLTVKSQPSFVDDWAKWNFSGYEGKDAYAEYRGVVQTMKDLGGGRGCGRALWENNNDEDKYGTPMALMLLPFWTDGCIGSMEGLYFEASGTTPYHFLTASAVSAHSSNPVRRLHYEDGDLDKGVTYLQTLGVRYYLAYSPSIVSKADANPELTPVASSGPWHVYEVKDSTIVTPLTVQPVVAEGVGTDRNKVEELGTSWFQNQDSWAALPAVDGPKDWQRIPLAREGQTTDTALATVTPATPITPVALPQVAITNVKQGDDSLSFHVDKVGVPVLVKVSYFPNWKASGATGPYRVAPNFMVVVPTSNNVTLHYGYTTVDYAGYGATLLGLVGLFFLWRKGRVSLEPDEVVLEDAYRRAGGTGTGRVTGYEDWDLSPLPLPGSPWDDGPPPADDGPTLFFDWDDGAAAPRDDGRAKREGPDGVEAGPRQGEPVHEDRGGEGEHGPPEAAPGR